MTFPLKPFQTLALKTLRRPGHVICVAPTGSGKSLIYERLARRPGQRTVLVTPLQALERQQRAKLERLGAEFWIGSPESLIPALPRLRAWRPTLLVVDECHCVGEWGEDFRPQFRRIPELLALPSVRRSLWLTATLPPAARAELRAQLPGPCTEIGEFALPAGLRIEARRVALGERIEAALAWIFPRLENPGLVFVPTRESAERLRRVLAAAFSVPVQAYHAGLSREERLTLEARMGAGQIRILVTTSAFGMGLHLPRLRWAVHWQAPASLLQLVQSVGRIGREGAGETCVFWDGDDAFLLRWLTQRSAERLEDLHRVFDFLSGSACRESALSAYFSPLSRSEPCGRCDNCLN